MQSSGQRLRYQHGPALFAFTASKSPNSPSSRLCLRLPYSWSGSRISRRKITCFPSAITQNRPMSITWKPANEN